MTRPGSALSRWLRWVAGGGWLGVLALDLARLQFGHASSADVAWSYWWAFAAPTAVPAAVVLALGVWLTRFGRAAPRREPSS